MIIELSYEEEFTELIESLKEKYSEKLFEIEGIGTKQLDMAKFSKMFFTTNTNEVTNADISVDANANVSDMSVVAYDAELMKPFARLNALYMLWKYSRKIYNTTFANEVIEHQISGDIYINDMHHFYTRPYCFNYATYDVAMSGLPYLERPKCVAPKYALTFKQQMEQFTAFASNNQSGASGQADFLIIFSYFVDKIFANKGDMHFKLKNRKKNIWQYVKDLLCTYVYTLNQPFRSNQSPFTNVSVYDKYFLEKICSDISFADGSTINIKTVEKLQLIFLDIMNEELERTPITYPVTTACFSVDENNDIMDEDFLQIVSEKNLKWGFINLFTGDNSLLSSCCRLRSSTDNEYFNSFGAGSSKIGSLGVCTINIPRLSKITPDEDLFIEKLKELTAVANKINNVKRHIIKERIKNGNLPLYTHGYMVLSKQYNTVGVIGLNEALAFKNKSILNEDGQELQFKMIAAINSVNDEYSKRYNCPVNCEQVPAENSSVKLCKKDKLLKVQDQFVLYANQFIPLTTNADMLDRIKLQGMYDAEFSGGAICHINCETEITDVSKMVDLIKYCAKQGVVYFAINYNLQQCENGHMTVGRKDICSICGSKIINNFTRVVGFLTNVHNWNKTRRELDYPNREFYEEI